jgi:RNA polymerase sigma-70 factor (ECF subfamily)
LVARLCLDRLRALDPVRFDSDLADGLAGIDPAADPVQALSQGEQVSQVQRAVQALAPRQRMAIGLWVYHDFTVAEIADAMQMERNAADQLLHRAKARLKKILEPANAE